jgi:excisionase family DNA binding protein
MSKKTRAPRSRDRHPRPISRRAPLPVIALGPADAADVLGIGKTRVYELLTDGRITARKEGTRTLIDYASMVAYFATLPAAEFTS